MSRPRSQARPDLQPVHQSIWQALRILRTTSVDDVLAALAGAVPATPHAVRRYLRLLTRAGYLHARAGLRAPGTRRLYTLVRDTGPLAPMVRRTLALHDPNLGREMLSVAEGDRHDG